MLAALATGCGRGSTEPPTTDRRDTGGVPDTAVTEDASTDAGADAAAPDTGMDTGALDTGAPDTGAPDTGAPDTGALDTGAPDTGASADLEAAIRTACARVATCVPGYDGYECISERLRDSAGFTPGCANASADYYNCVYTSADCYIFEDLTAFYAHVETTCGPQLEAKDALCE